MYLRENCPKKINMLQDRKNKKGFEKINVEIFKKIKNKNYKNKIIGKYCIPRIMLVNVFIHLIFCKYYEKYQNYQKDTY